jgi:hypothetical protein
MAIGSIDNFIGSFKTDVARPNRFQVRVTPPSSLADSRWPQGMMYRCETAELPGKTFMTYDLKTYGPTEKFPYQHAYNDINLTFIVGDNMNEKKRFEEWIELISPINNYDFSYKDSYAGTIQIFQYDVSGTQTYAVELIDAYPTGINQLDLDWSSDGHHKLVVTFAYTYWEEI